MLEISNKSPKAIFLALVVGVNIKFVWHSKAITFDIKVKSLIHSQTCSIIFKLRDNKEHVWAYNIYCAHYV